MDQWIRKTWQYPSSNVKKDFIHQNSCAGNLLVTISRSTIQTWWSHLLNTHHCKIHYASNMIDKISVPLDGSSISLLKQSKKVTRIRKRSYVKQTSKRSASIISLIIKHNGGYIRGWYHMASAKKCHHPQ